MDSRQNDKLINNEQIEYPADTIIKISHLIVKLFNIYLQDFPGLIHNKLHKTADSQIANSANLFLIQQGMTHNLMGIYIKLQRHSVLNNSKPYVVFINNICRLIHKSAKQWVISMPDIDGKIRKQLILYMVSFSETFASIEQIKSGINGFSLLRDFKEFLENLVLNNAQVNAGATNLKTLNASYNLDPMDGKVVLQNDLMQLIQYSPVTEEVYKIPILFTPPWINKDDILDLSGHNFIVNWLIKQGFTVFMISWVNDDQVSDQKTFDDYMFAGPIQALNMITTITKSNRVHTVGSCIGGTLLSYALAYLRAKNDVRGISATFLIYNEHITLQSINTPAFFIASAADHINACSAIYADLKLLNAPLKFILVESQYTHSAVNIPEAKNKHAFYSNENFIHSADYIATATEWHKTSIRQNGSWWPYWTKWLLSFSNAKVTRHYIDG